MELVPHDVIVIITFFCFNGSSNAENLPRTVSQCCVPGFMYVITANKEHWIFTTCWLAWRAPAQPPLLLFLQLAGLCPELESCSPPGG